MPVKVSRRLTGIPPARLAARRSIRSSPPLQGRCRGVEGADRGLPVDLGHRGDAVGDADAGVDELVLEVLAVRPEGVADEQVDTCLKGVDAAGAGAQCGG
jgi:hypothetical protein